MKRLLLATIFVFASAGSHGQQFAVAELRATGSQRFAEQDILRSTGLAKGKQTIPISQVKDAAAKLLGSGAFKEVSYKHSAVPTGMKVEFAVRDADEFVHADFENIVWLPLPELIKELNQRVPLFNGQLPKHPGGSLQEDVAAALQGLLNERGVKTTVSYAACGPREGITEAYVYSADGVEIKIGQLNLAGASSAFSPLLEAAARPLLGTHFQRSTVAKFVNRNLLDIYRSRGHLRAEFQAPQVTVASHKEAETAVAITLPVVEGRAYTFGGVRWSGQSVRPDVWLNERIRVGVSQPANGVQLDTDFRNIRSEYARLGYMHMDLDLRPIFDEAAGTIRYEATVHEGEPFTMGKLDIAGLQPSSAERVRQRWRMREGDAFDPDYVKNFFTTHLRLPEGMVYVVEQSEGEAKNSLDLTLIFCKATEKCLASAPNRLYIPDPEPRRR